MLRQALTSACSAAKSMIAATTTRALSTRVFQSTSILYAPQRDIPIRFELKEDGKEIIREVLAYEGETLLELAQENDIEIEGACEGTCACSTCHLYVEESRLEELPPPTDEENDMLDLAWGLKDNSRLGCQIEVEREYAGMKFAVPEESNNNY